MPEHDQHDHLRAPRDDTSSSSAQPILHLLDCLNPGGTERQLIGHLRHVDRRRWRPIVGAFHEGGTLLPEVLGLGVDVRAFPIHTRLAHPNTLRQIVRIASMCRAEGIRLIHAHDFYADLVGLVAARLAGVPVIASRRDLGHWLSRPQRRALGVACRLSDRVVANSRSVALVAEDGLALPTARLRLVPNGIDLDRFDRDAAGEPDPAVPFLDEPRGSRPPTVIVVSNLNLPDKGHADLLEATAQLRRQGTQLRLVLVGDGAMRAAIETLAVRLGIEDAVRLAGRRLDVPKLLARADVACLPSWAEGFPNAVMEAMAASLPVVATAVGGCPELVDHGSTGLLVPPRDPARLAEALRALCADPESARAMGRRARGAVAERFSLRAAAAAVDAVYSELCGPPALDGGQEAGAAR